MALVVGAFILQGHRDFGQGMFAQRPGPAGAGIAGNVWGLGFKLNRGSLISWLIAFAGLGLIFGTLASSIGDLVANSPEMAKIIASGATDAAHLTFAFLVTILQIVAIIAAVMGVQIVLRVYAEEVDYRVEPLLAGSLRRRSYLASNAVIGLLGPVMDGGCLNLTALDLGLVLVPSGHEESVPGVDPLVFQKPTSAGPGAGTSPLPFSAPKMSRNISGNANVKNSTRGLRSSSRTRPAIQRRSSDRSSEVMRAPGSAGGRRPPRSEA
jgi:ABC-2 type transport system permease protein